MGVDRVNDTSAVADLLTLITRAIEQLQRSIALFESSERAGGAEHLATVIGEIDEYLEISESDPLLRLASLPPSHVRDGLMNVRSDLVSVIDELDNKRP